MWIFNLKTISISAVLLSFNGFSQTGWTWTQKADMPFQITNNAVSQGEMAGNPYVYSFGGIDTSKVYTGINKRSFRYDVTNDQWTEIDTLPVVLPLIASSANTVKNKIYIIGGYHVYANGSETSSDEVIIYDPELDVYESNGAPVPVPIDDQTQVVWNDSLIYVITGWSNSGNVANVQIYDPAVDSWTVGTPVTNDNNFKAFGSSGYIVGDTIFYYGGASHAGIFPARDRLRKGIINAADPTQITWTLEDDAPNTNYRSACVSHGNNVFWIGGSETSYNYNGIAYNGSGGVPPAMTISRYDSQTQTWYEGQGAPFGVMDLRGAGQISPTSWVICGGMESGQQVSDKTYLLEYDPIVGSVRDNSLNPSITGKYISNHFLFESIEIVDLNGKLIENVNTQTGIIQTNKAGVYLVRVFSKQGVRVQKLFLSAN